MAKRRRSGDHPAADDGDVVQGVVTRVDSRQCRVDTGDGEIDCRIRGILFREEKTFSRPVAVGDRVLVSRPDTPPAVVTGVLERRNYLARPRRYSPLQQMIAANLDQAVIVLSCDEPPPNLRLLDRMLVACEQNGYRSTIAFNKVDLLAERAGLDEITAVYRKLDYEVIATSVVTGEGIEALRGELRDRISIFSGMSGVGKSALLTAVQPDLELKSGDVSSATGKGKHTTTHVSLLRLAFGGYVVDTPGIREFGFATLDAAEVARGFLDFLPYVDSCRFRRCTHDHEVDCSVIAAVEEGAIDADRYDSYLRIIGSLEDD